MIYEELAPISQSAADAAFASGDGRAIGRALLRLALHGPDWRVAEQHALRHLTHDDVWVRRNAATSLGHVARLSRDLDVDSVVPALKALLSDPEVGGFAEDALDDIEVFMGVRWKNGP
ncbi:hypothetical protein [Longimicrobium sp.]|jgi:hypothetical protein|uniref:hypothetical protein n=1 Tax=Longimicrobium sp. TaxID=2029185 RepID=UPI002F949836